MVGLNKITLIGHIAESPKIIVFERGGKRVEFVFATKDSYRENDSDTWKEVEDYHSCFASGGLAGIAESKFKKGTRLYLEGKLKHRTYIDNREVKRFVTEIRVSDFILIDKDVNLEKDGNIF